MPHKFLESVGREKMFFFTFCGFVLNQQANLNKFLGEEECFFVYYLNACLCCIDVFLLFTIKIFQETPQLPAWLKFFSTKYLLPKYKAMDIQQFLK